MVKLRWIAHTLYGSYTRLKPLLGKASGHWEMVGGISTLGSVMFTFFLSNLGHIYRSRHLSKCSLTRFSYIGTFLRESIFCGTKFKGLSSSSISSYWASSLSSNKNSLGGLKDSAWPGRSLLGARIAFGASLGFHGTIVSSYHTSHTSSSGSLSLSSLSCFFSSNVFILPCLRALRIF